MSAHWCFPVGQAHPIGLFSWLAHSEVETRMVELEDFFEWGVIPSGLPKGILETAHWHHLLFFLANNRRARRSPVFLEDNISLVLSRLQVK